MMSEALRALDAIDAACAELGADLARAEAELRALLNALGVEVPAGGNP
jgi:hypothetical protein